MDIYIRDMLDKDWEQVAEIYKQGVDTNIATFSNTIPKYEDFDKSHLPHCRYVATIKDKVVGWVATSFISSRCVYAGVVEVSIYIHNNYQGKGVGRKLLNHLIEQSEKSGIWTLQSGILQENEASLNLHKKCGFREVGYREKIGKDKYGTWRSTILMERRSNSSSFLTSSQQS